MVDFSKTGHTLSQPAFTCSNQQWKHQKNMWNLFKVNKKDSKNVNDIVIGSLLLTLNRFRILFWCFHCRLWLSKGQLVWQKKDFENNFYWDPQQLFQNPSFEFKWDLQWSYFIECLKGYKDKNWSRTKRWKLLVL